MIDLGIHVQDNFFKDPYEVRRTILNQSFSDSEYAWPGFRSVTPERISNYILESARRVVQVPGLQLCGEGGTNCQYITKEYGEGSFHHDGDGTPGHDGADFTSINFLSLEPPVDSGTEVCDSTGNPDATGIIDMELWGKHLREKEKFYKNPKPFINSYKYARLVKRINSHFDPTAKIPNKFNRWLIFDSNRHHRAQKFFGTSASNARLIIVCFFKK
tara:strand:+ start:793 stop:1440 length:648 start_codon:yes stop_codon:yes gene_type:complete